ncbi:hypothetical protein VPHK367G1_0003 [Vibrio phage K367 g1]|nr:hypothetical protein MYOV072v1_p0027 [Vibrio phage 207E29.1]
MKHKHYDMIVAKAANMELVVFLESNQGWSEKENQSDIQFHEQFDYFLCLPQHKEACLHWLNGGDLQINRKGHGFLDWGRPNRGWVKEVSFMFDINEFRIKPKKEKRWIVWDTAQSIPERESYKSLEDAMLNFDYPDAQFIEIEVEV